MACRLLTVWRGRLEADSEEEEEDSMKKIIVASLTALVLIGSDGTSWAQSNSNHESGAAQVGLGAGSVLTSLVYAPVKASICVLGAVGSGFALPFAGPKRAGAIASSSCSGSWVITPSNLKGQQRVQVIAP